MIGRKGFDYQWDDCDADIKREIRKEWRKIVDDCVARNGGLGSLTDSPYTDAWKKARELSS